MGRQRRRLPAVSRSKNSRRGFGVEICPRRAGARGYRRCAAYNATGNREMAKPPKVPRPVKPPIQPPRPGQIADPTIGLIQEKLIGRTVVEWSKLEACMEDGIWHLLNVPIETGRILTARLDAVVKIRLLRELGERLLPESNWHELSQILDKIDIRREDRNFIGHGTWGRSDVAPLN